MQVQAAAKKAKASSVPPAEELWNYVYSEDGGKEKAEKQKFIRMPQYKNSIVEA